MIETTPIRVVAFWSADLDLGLTKAPRPRGVRLDRGTTGQTGPPSFTDLEAHKYGN